MHRVGVIGTGGMGAVHTIHYRRIPGIEILAFDSDPERLNAYCKRFDVTPSNSLEDLISRSDFVDICLPTQLHMPVALQAIAAGRHVLVEKPMAATFAECVTMVKAADKANVALMPAQVVRFFPEFRRAHDLVTSGKIGKPAVARTRRGGLAPKREWFLDFSQSGGVILDVAVHDLDWLRWTLGNVTSVTARSANMTRAGRGQSLVGDYALIVLEFECGAIAHVEATWLDPAGFRTTFEVCGSEGMIEWDSRNTAALQGATQSGVVRESPLDGCDDPYYNQLNSFFEAVNANLPPPLSAHDGAMAVGIAEAALESTSTLNKVVPPSAL